MPWLLVDKTWQTSIPWQINPPSNRAEMPWIPVHQHWQRTILWQMGPPGNRAETSWIPVHQHWQRTILWQMDPPPDQLDSGMRYQLLLWDEVYRLWYFNFQLSSLCNRPSSQICPLYSIPSLGVIFNCHHFAMDHLHKCVHFTVYHL